MNRVPTNLELKQDIEDLTEQVAALAKSIEGMTKAWENATFLVAVIKWMGSLVLAISGLWFVLTHFGQAK